MNNDNRKDYQTVLEEHTPLVCNDAVEKKSSSTRLATLLSIGIAVFAFLAMANSISELKSTLADLQSQLQALTGQSTPLFGSALQGSVDVGDACVADNECGSGACQTKRHAFCVEMPSQIPLYSACKYDQSCASGYCNPSNTCSNIGKRGGWCLEDKGCASKSCRSGGFGGRMACY